MGIIDGARQEEIITSVVTLCEVCRKVKRDRGEETALEAVAALSQTKVVDIGQTRSSCHRDAGGGEEREAPREPWKNQAIYLGDHGLLAHEVL